MTNTEAIDVFVRFVEMKEGKENGVVAPHDVFIDACKLAISALQDRPIGHWIEKDIVKNRFTFEWYCDSCGCGCDLWYNFCPNCGAKMVDESAY